MAEAACTVALPSGETLTLTARPLGLPTTAPLTFRVTSSDPRVVVDAVEIRGVNMDMGLTRLPADASGKAQGYLPVCSQREMHWRLDVVATVGAAPRVVQFFTQTGARGSAGEDDG